MAESLEKLFEEYKATGDVALRNRIAEEYLYVADILAKKFVGRGVDYDDLRQVASLALIKGIDRFDPSLGMQFSTFITPTITGEIKNYFRDKSRIVKLPRRLNEISVAVRSFVGEYEGKYGEKPSVAKIASALSFSEEDVVRALEIGGTVSLDSVSASEDGEDQTLYAVLPDNDDRYERLEIKDALRAATEDFSDTEKALVKYRYADQLSQSETAKKLGVSQMFVSRLERKLLGRLKERLQDSV